MIKHFMTKNLFDKILHNITSVPAYAKVVMNSRGPTEPAGVTIASKALVEKGEKSDAICQKSDAVCQLRCRPTDADRPGEE